MVIPSSEWEPVCSRHEFSLMASSTPAEGGIREVSDSTGACSVTRALNGYGTCESDFATKAAKSPSGALRGLNRTDVLGLPVMRSTRNVRQSLRFMSQATKYQR